MGHSTISMTFDTYGHLMPGAIGEAAEATNAYLAKLAGRPALPWWCDDGLALPQSCP